MDKNLKTYAALVEAIKSHAEAGDKDTAKALKEWADIAFEKYAGSAEGPKRQESDTDSGNFGLAVSVIESALAPLIGDKKGRRILREYVSLLKNDPVLRAQHDLLSALDGETRYLAMEAIRMRGHVDKKKLAESVGKLAAFAKKHGLSGRVEDPKRRTVCEMADKLATTPRTLANIAKIDKYARTLAEALSKNQDGDIVSSFNAENGTGLREEHAPLATAINNGQGETVFNDCLRQCVEAVNKQLEEHKEQPDNAALKAKLLEYKERLLDKRYDQATVAQDVDSLLRLKDILLEK